LRIGHELGYEESKAWHMTPYKILTLWEAHNFIHGNAKKKLDPIDEALGGL
jgi:hypothetical protein